MRRSGGGAPRALLLLLLAVTAVLFLQIAAFRLPGQPTAAAVQKPHCSRRPLVRAWLIGIGQMQ